MNESKWSRPVSESLFGEARRLMPGGVNSPVRAFRSVDMDPLFMLSGQGCYLTDEDGHSYIDYVASWGPLILGHRPPSVVLALENCLKQFGTSFGAPTRLENRLAAMIVEALPGIEMVRMVNSGTEAVMSALRLARAFTGREKIVKFAGCYHGHADPMLIQAGSGALTFGVPDSPGVSARTAEDTIVLPYNDLTAAKACFAEHGSQIAAVIVEPVAGNMGCVLPQPGFLQLLRELSRKSGSLLIFDEVITGFRVAYGGAQTYFEVIPDLTILGKIIGGGLPVGAYGGRKEIMEWVAPQGSVYQAGTLSGNPLAMTAGIAALEGLQQPLAYEKLEEKQIYLTQALQSAAAKARVDLTVNSLASMFTLFFTAKPVTDLESAKKCDISAFKRFFKAMLQRGIYFGPSPFETSFISLAHDQAALDRTAQAAAEAFLEIAGN